MKIALPSPLAAALTLFLAGPAQATLGIFEHGNGIKAMGMGGISYTLGEETTALAANPAHAVALGRRVDIGSDFFNGLANARFEGNSIAPNERYRTDAKRYFYIPQGGFSLPLNDRIAIGMTLLSAGLGPDYPDSPYERFGGAHRVSLGLGSTSLVTAMAYRVGPENALGFSLNTGYQVLSVKGVQFIADPSVSEAPSHVSNQGKDGAMTLGYSLGWVGELSPGFRASFGYRSKSWAQKHHDYRGLIAEGGRLELPAIFGGGVAITPGIAPDWTVAFEAQRYAYRNQKTFRNGLSKLSDGQGFGGDDGPGFGFDDQNAYKLGVAWRTTPRLTLRAGYIRASQLLNRENTLLGFLGPVPVTTQYSLGATYRLSQWEASVYAVHCPEQEMRGRNSIPPAFGGGEANVSDELIGAGFSIGRRFGQ